MHPKIIKSSNSINDFNLGDIFSGNLYGLEKFWAFLKYYKGKTKFEVNSELRKILQPFKVVDDFRKEVSFAFILRIYYKGKKNAVYSKNICG